MGNKRYKDESFEDHNTPDKWCVVRIVNDGEVVYKLLMSWYGGYLDGDRWRMNSGIQYIELEGDFYLMTGYSGSVYKCHKTAYGMNGVATGVYNNMVEAVKNNSNRYAVSIMDDSINWLELEL